MSITYSPEYVICPYCGREHGDAWEWAADSREHETLCDDCGEKFIHWAEYSPMYYARPA